MLMIHVYNRDFDRKLGKVDNAITFYCFIRVLCKFTSLIGDERYGYKKLHFFA